jgi:hypothetical protein
LQVLVSRSRLQEPLTFTGLIIVGALLRVKEVPRASSARCPTLTSIVFLEPSLQIAHDAHVEFSRRLASKDINADHCRLAGPEVFALNLGSSPRIRFGAGALPLCYARVSGPKHRPRAFLSKAVSRDGDALPIPQNEANPAERSQVPNWHTRAANSLSLKPIRIEAHLEKLASFGRITYMAPACPVYPEQRRRVYPEPACPEPVEGPAVSLPNRRTAEPSNRRTVEWADR